MGTMLTIMSKHNDYLILKDMIKKDAVNIIGNHRITTDVPKQYDNEIYCYGPCTAFGAFATDEKTIESFLQRIINSNNYPYSVHNYGSIGSGEIINNDLNTLYTLMDTKFNEGDVAIFFGYSIFNNMIKLNPEKIISTVEIFSNSPFDKVGCFESSDHIDDVGNHIIAEMIFNRMKKFLRRKSPVNPFFTKITRQNKIDSNLQKYLLKLSNERVDLDRVGAIVMNCNPFTKGHMYLIEQALNLVDFLYIFVVEEDASEFSFKDRFTMVKLNCEHFTNVKVLPSGKYMISSFTFAEYFKKDDLQDKNIVPAKDVRIFGSSIAPCLNIKTRFVGEEPLDNVTRQYNETLKQILREYGVRLVEIPRLQNADGEIINATKVRRLLKEGNIEECKKYLTDRSYNYILNKSFN